MTNGEWLAMQEPKKAAEILLDLNDEILKTRRPKKPNADEYAEILGSWFKAEHEPVEEKPKKRERYTEINTEDNKYKYALDSSEKPFWDYVDKDGEKLIASLTRGAVDKLGALEDIEAELGIDLLTLFKALKNGAWFNIGYFKGIDKKDRFMHIKEVCFGGDGLIWGNYLYKGIRRQATCLTRQCGRTWALTKEELETHESLAYCDKCDKDAEFTTKEIQRLDRKRGITYAETLCRCAECGNYVEYPAITEKNLKNYYEALRAIGQTPEPNAENAGRRLPKHGGGPMMGESEIKVLVEMTDAEYQEWRARRGSGDPAMTRGEWIAGTSIIDFLSAKMGAPAIREPGLIKWRRRGAEIIAREIRLGDPADPLG